MSRKSELIKDLIKFVKDRPGHDLRYALDSGKIRKKLFWKPKTSFKNGLKNILQFCKFLEHYTHFEEVRGLFLDC